MLGQPQAGGQGFPVGQPLLGLTSWENSRRCPAPQEAACVSRQTPRGPRVRDLLHAMWSIGLE